MNARDTAARIIARWLRTGDFPNRLLEAVTADRAFVMEMVYGVVRGRRRLEWMVSQYANRQPDADILALLLIGFYQLTGMSDVADYAAVNETVTAAKFRFPQGQANFINAVLRQGLRDREKIRQHIPQLPLAVRESHPDLLVERWTRHYGAEKTRQLCEFNNTRPDVVIVVNSLAISVEDYQKRLKSAGISASAVPVARPAALTIPHGVRVEDLPGYAAGWFTVIDPSAMQAVALMDPQPGETVLDACAAPGGKTFLIALAMRRQGKLVAIDMHQDRLARLRENLRRLDCAGFVRVIQGDALKLSEKAGVNYDRILLDVPCTNTGVIRRKPDVRWRFSEQRLARLARDQRAMLDRLAGRLKPGGRLVYSTCSLEPEENETLIKDWLKTHPAFTLLAEKKLFPPAVHADGAYAALLRKA